MARLTSDAAGAYMSATIEAYEAGSVSLSVLEYRMRFVRDQAEPGSAEYRIASELTPEGDEVEDDDWPKDEGRKEGPAGEAEGQLTIDDQRDGEPPVLSLIVQGVAELSNWKFNQSDPDFHPSIPHGHSITGRVEKLDVYLGYVFRGATQIRREPRSVIVALWNYDPFRQLARTAIHWYSTTYPNYLWPLRIRGRHHIIPKRRRPYGR
jgi:hypothetical protein